jgi:hypothetical protein
VGDTYTVNLQEMSGSRVSGSAVLTGVAPGDVSILVEVEGATDGQPKLLGGISSCPADTLPGDVETLVTLTPLTQGSSETSPIGVSTEAFTDQNIFVFSGPWAILVFADSGDPIACGIIPQE